MVQRNLSDDEKALLRDCLGTLETLEVLLLMRAESTKAWQSQELAARMQRDSATCSASLQVLSVGRLIRRSPDIGSEAYFYHPGDERLASTVDKLVVSYVENRVAVLQLMTANALARLRAAALEHFNVG